MKQFEVEDQEKDKRDNTVQGNPFCQDEFIYGILPAEEGELSTLKESKEAFEHWLSHRDF
jgi:hypothetical protein